MKRPGEHKRATSRLPALVLSIIFFWGVWISTQALAAATVFLDSALEPALLEVRLNGENTGITLLFQRTPRALWAAKSDLTTLGLQLEGVPTTDLQGQPYINLQQLDPWLRWKIDEVAQRIALEVDPARLQENALKGPGGPAKIPPRQLPCCTGLTLNYDVGTSMGGQRAWTGFFQTGLFSAYGFGSSSWRVNSNAVSGSESRLRLDSYWQIDQPEQANSWRIGDTISRGTQLGIAAHFAGVQWGRDFSTRPDMVITPTATLAGQTALAAQAQLFVNQSIRARIDLPPGPFKITDITTTGREGEVRLLVRDTEGREQSVVVPYYSAPTLLKEGLTDFSLEMGALRQDYGLQSNSYGPGFISALVRRGVSQSFTLEGQLQSQVGGPSTASAVAIGAAPWGLWSAGLGLGAGTGEGRGWVTDYSYSGQWGRWGASAGLRHANPAWRPVGISATADRLADTARLSASVALPGSQSLSLNWLKRKYLSQSQSVRQENVVGLLYGVGTFSGGYLLVGSTWNLQGQGASAFSLSWLLPLDLERNFSLNFQRNKNSDGTANTGWSSTYTKSATETISNGYRVTVADHNYQQVSAVLQRQYAAINLEATNRNGKNSAYASASGSVLVFGGGMHFARELGNSFAVVRTGGIADVPVIAANRLVGTTDKNGEMLLPNLQSYQVNTVQIDMEQVPLDVEIGNTELKVVPSRRILAVADFPVRRIRDALLRVALPGGQWMPAGASVRVVGSAEKVQVANEGLVYLTQLAEHNVIQINHSGGICQVSFDRPVNAAPSVDLGRFECQKVSP